MKMKVMMPLLATLVLWGSISSCSKKEESPEPQPKQVVEEDPPPPPPPPPSGGDTTAMFTDNVWITQKVYKDGVEQVGHFLINTSYKFNLPNTYIFSIPGFPSANGTWVFNSATKSKVEITNQGGTHTWDLLSITSSSMVIEETISGVLWKYEFIR